MLTMKSIVALILLALLPCEYALAADARIVLPDLRLLEAKASEVVSVNLDAPLLGLAAGFLDDRKPDEAAAKELVAGLEGVYVRSFTFDADFAYANTDIDALRRQLSAPRWQRVVEVRSLKERTNCDVYISMEGNRANGLVIIATEPRELTIVNIVGSVDLRKLHRLEGRFGVPNLQLEAKGPQSERR
jgi:hypothetical protein